MNFYDLLKALGHEPESIFVDPDLIETEPEPETETEPEQK